MDRCYYGLVRVAAVTTYFKGCERSVACGTHCDTAENLDECRVRCCTGDRCNNETNLSLRPPPTEKPLTCYSCYSSESWAECERTQVEMVCLSDVVSCVETFVERGGGDKLFVKGCGTEEAGNCSQAKPGCKPDPDITECQIKCCENKNCIPVLPTSAAPVVQPRSVRNDSWAECEKKRACAAGFATCQNVYTNMQDLDTVNANKGCTTKEECHRVKEKCDKGNFNEDAMECDTHCCEEFLCTATATRLVSSLFISGCAVLLMFVAV